MTNTEVTQKLNELKLLFPSGSYWNHNPSHGNDEMSVRNEPDEHNSHNTSSGSCGCNFFGRGIQCHGFALFLAKLVFNSYPNVGSADGIPSNNGKVFSGWTMYTTGNYNNITLEPGDIIRTSSHAAIVWSINGETVNVAECLGSIGSEIAWGTFNRGQYTTIAQIKANANYIMKAPKTNSVHVSVTFDPNGGTCSISNRTYISSSAYAYLPTPSRTGYTFVGWWPEKETDSEEYTHFKNVPVTYNHKLYAHWAKTYKLTNVGANKCLNIHGNNLAELGNGINVTLWSTSSSNEQKWLISKLSNKQTIKSIIDKNFGLNVYRSGTPYNCNIHRTFKNETDSIIDIIADGNYFKIKLHNYNLFLTTDSTSNGSNVFWSESSSSNYQKWNITQV